MVKSYLSLYLLTAVILSAFLFQSCGEAFDASGPETQESVTITGIVLDKETSQPIEAAFVEITAPLENQQTTTTDSTGKYTFTLQAVSSTVVSIKASKQNYDPVTESLTITPGGDFTEVDITLTPEVDDDGVGGQPQGAAAIVLSGVPIQAINIAETGDVISAPFTFQVQDSAGRALNEESSVEVQFTIVSGPGGGESLVPATASTNAQGQVTTTLFSGNKAGPVKVQALIDRPDIGLTVKSSPALVAIHGGFPEANHFSIAIDKNNFEGFGINNVRNTISVVVGDKFSNPVKPGTVVYFETTGGIIQGSGGTDQDGIVTVDLISGNPRPANGLAMVTATTVNANNIRIQKTVDVVFSGSQAEISASPTTFSLPPGGGKSFTYSVTDINGNPMAAGTQLSVEAGDGIELTGDVGFTLGDFINPGPGATEFNFSIRDTDTESNAEADLTIKISVTTPSGNTTTYSEISGTRHKAPVY